MEQPWTIPPMDREQNKPPYIVKSALGDQLGRWKASGFQQIHTNSALLVVMPGATSSFLLLVAMPCYYQ